MSLPALFSAHSPARLARPATPPGRTPGCSLATHQGFVPPPAPVSSQPARPAEALPERGEPQRFLAEHYHALCRRLGRRLGNRELAAESLHEAWLRLAGQSPRPSVANVEAYVFTVACNAAMDLLTAENRRRQREESGDELELAADPAPGPEAQLEAASELAATLRRLERLPPRQRALVHAVGVDGRPREEVARQFRVSLRSVDRAVAQARAVWREAEAA